MKKISARMWATLILIGFVGQLAWTIENMYFNVFLYNTISTDPRHISAMVGWSAAAATLTTLLMGALSDRVGKRKLFICGGYILWGASTAAFGLITVENAARLFPAVQATTAAAAMVVVLDCVMTFFGSTANDAAFNAYITDAVDSENRGKTAYFGAIDKCKFKGKVVPGDKLRLETRIIKRKGPVGVGEAIASVDGRVVVRAELTFMIG